MRGSSGVSRSSLLELVRIGDLVPKLLVADDDATLSTNMEHWLKEAGYLVDLAGTADEAASLIETFEYDLVLLDWEFPDGAGINIIEAYRKKGGLIPILMLTGRSSLEDKERGLDAGADDYLTKPFHMKEVCARVRALLRRPALIVSGELKVGRIVLNAESRRVLCAGKEVKLQPMEFAVLEFFMRNPGKVFSPEKIIERVWETTTDVSLHAVYTCMKRLRQKLDKTDNEAEPKSSVFRTVPGSGYELLAEAAN